MDRRRKTLTGLSPSQLNSRASLGPARVTKDGKTVQKQSLFGAGRSSLIGVKPLANNNAPSRLGIPVGPRR